MRYFNCAQIIVRQIILLKGSRQRNQLERSKSLVQDGCCLTNMNLKALYDLKLPQLCVKYVRDELDVIPQMDG